jgi:heme oxygenase
MLNRPLESGVPGIIEALRGATRSRHARLASLPAMLRLFEGDYAISEYRAHLSRLLGFFEPLECAVAKATAPEDQALRLHRSNDLREDLRIMGATARNIAAIERCTLIPPIATAGLRGYTYVIMGSMLGGRILIQRLRAVLGPAASFCFYGGGSVPYEVAWAGFCSDLEEEKDGENVQSMCATAVGIFDAYTAWLSEPPAQSGNR